MFYSDLFPELCCKKSCDIGGSDHHLSIDACFFVQIVRFRFMLYKSCSALRAMNLQQIICESNVDVLSFTGIRWPAQKNREYETSKVDGFNVVIWGWGRGSVFSNFAADVAIALVEKLGRATL